MGNDPQPTPPPPNRAAAETTTPGSGWLKALSVALLGLLVGALSYLANDLITGLKDKTKAVEDRESAVERSFNDFRKDSDKDHQNLRNAILLASDKSDKKTKRAIELILSQFRSIAQRQEELRDSVTVLQKIAEADRAHGQQLGNEMRAKASETDARIVAISSETDGAWQSVDLLLKPKVRESVNKTLAAIVSDWRAAQEAQARGERTLPGSGFVPGGTTVSTMPEISRISIDHGRVTIVGVVPSKEARETIRKTVLEVGAREIVLDNLRIQP
jgi:hypothetical protein